MSSNAFAGVGTIFRRWSGSAWAALAEINSIAGPGNKRDVIDVTSLDSTGGYREFIAGFREAGDVKLSMNFSRSTFELVKADFESNTLQPYEIDLPDVDATVLEFHGLVIECPLTIPADNKVTVEVTIRISGSVDIDSGPSAGLGH